MAISLHSVTLPLPLGFRWRRAVTLRPAPGVQGVLAVLAVALAARLIAAALMANTYDEDEFVYLTLGRAVAHGAVPYRNFPFFHPPGILVLLAGLNPLASFWWPAIRLLNVAIDSFTAVLVWGIATQVYGRRAAFAAGLLYALNPLALISAGRVTQEIPAAALCTAGLLLLVSRSSRRIAVLAGIFLATAVWMKYSQLAFLPVYVLAARRRAAVTAGLLVGLCLLFAPYLPLLPAVGRETVVWQLAGRPRMAPATRFVVTTVFWLLINPTAVLAVVRRRGPPWLLLGFLSGAAFFVTATSYPHYLLAVAPLAALLGGQVLAESRERAAGATLIALTLAGWAASGAMLAAGPTPVFNSTFTQVAQVSRLVQRIAPGNTPILGNRPVIAYLMHRPSVADYFWDDRSIDNARYLERTMPRQVLAVKLPAGDPLAFPPGFWAYLNRHARRRHVAGANVWYLGAGFRTGAAITAGGEFRADHGNVTHRQHICHTAVTNEAKNETTSDASVRGRNRTTLSRRLDRGAPLPD